MPDDGYAAVLLRNTTKRQRGLDWHKLQIAERQRACSLPRHIVKAAPHRIRLPVELQRGVVRHDRIVREMRGDEIRVDGRMRGLGAGRNDGEETAADADEAARRDVLRQDVRAGVGTAAPRGVRANELVPAEDGVCRKEVEGAAKLAHWRNNDY
jgi:hypothetical protein